MQFGTRLFLLLRSWQEMMVAQGTMPPGQPIMYAPPQVSSNPYMPLQLEAMPHSYHSTWYCLKTKDLDHYDFCFVYLHIQF